VQLGANHCTNIAIVQKIARLDQCGCRIWTVPSGHQTPYPSCEPVNVKVTDHAPAAYFSPRKANQALKTSKWMIGWYGIVYNCTHFRSQLLAVPKKKKHAVYSLLNWFD
jgi:hypothetical protein